MQALVILEPLYPTAGRSWQVGRSCKETLLKARALFLCRAPAFQTSPSLPADTVSAQPSVSGRLGEQGGGLGEHGYMYGQGDTAKNFCRVTKSALSIGHEGINAACISHKSMTLNSLLPRFFFVFQHLLHLLNKLSYKDAEVKRLISALPL